MWSHPHCHPLYEKHIEGGEGLGLVFSVCDILLTEGIIHVVYGTKNMDAFVKCKPSSLVIVAITSNTIIKVILKTILSYAAAFLVGTCYI